MLSLRVHHCQQSVIIPVLRRSIRNTFVRSSLPASSSFSRHFCSSRSYHHDSTPTRYHSISESLASSSLFASPTTAHNIQTPLPLHASPLSVNNNIPLYSTSPSVSDIPLVGIDIVNRYADQDSTKVTLQQMYIVGLNVTPQMLLSGAQFLHKEVKHSHPQ